MTIVSGPCSWTSATVSGACCNDWIQFSPTLQAQAMDFAKTIIWAATGRQFGLCQLTVRPCGRRCQGCAQGWYYDGFGTWVPYIADGVWKNCWCGSDPACCTCDPDCIVYLPGPVHSLISVKVDGTSLAVSGIGAGIFVLDQQWLVRSDTTACWPRCADQNLMPGNVNAFEVTYLRGRPVPDVVAIATMTYACEYAKACLALPCRLPSRVQSISRQGITISMVDINELLRNNLTGLLEVDQLIAAFNPYGLKGRTRFWSPDLQEGRQVTFP